MKNNILRISILPLITCIVLAVTGLQQRGNDKGNKENKEQKGEDRSKGNKDNKGSQTENRQPGNSPEQHGNNGKGDDKDNNGNNGRGNDRKSDNGRGNSDKKDDHADNGKMKGTARKEVIRWANDGSINWNLNDFPNRKHPKDHKKVAVCHATGNDFPVNISISENALQAHLNHGDQLGKCTITYGDRWPKNYIIARETVYNVYENTWETMSYSEALLRLAMDKLLGIKTDLAQNRARFTPVEIQRREVLIMDLQNNTTSLENQLIMTRQRLDGVNIYVQL